MSLSKFLQRSLAQLKAKKIALKGLTLKSRPDQQILAESSQARIAILIKPTSVSDGLTHLLMIITAVFISYWFMRIAQIPTPPSQISNGSNQAVNKGMTLYSNQDGALAYDLFDSKPLATDRIRLSGVVVTGKSKDGTLDGYAIFDLEGKPTNVISIGESLGKGLSLQSIGVESATLLYQGQKLEFKLSKPGIDKKRLP